MQTVTPSSNPITFGLAVRRLRVARGMTQGELADMSGVSRTYISALEHGRKNPTLDTQERVAGALEIRLSELVRQAEEIR